MRDGSTRQTGPSVLIVDDSLTVRMDLAESFEAAGLDTVVCASASEARTALAQHDVALLVLDVCLPDADGFDLLAEVRESPASADAPVMMLTSASEVPDRVRGLRSGADEYVGKPYDAAYVVARARELMGVAEVRAKADVLTVLVIDDSPSVRGELREGLEAAGYRVLTAESGEEGLTRAALERPSAVVVDGELPGIDGATVVRKLRLDEALRGTPCLLLTGSEEGAAELRALDAGADAFVRKGCPFDVLLARLGALVRASDSTRLAAASALTPQRILAVDDSPTYLHELSSVMREEGYDVVPARSGEEALEVLALQPVDCILLDLVMPGLGGHDTCKRIKQSPGLREIPLVLLTAYDERDAMLRGLATGADDYIAKGDDFDVLKARVRAQLRRKRFEDENRRIRQELLESELEAERARAGEALAAARASLVEELERKNAELEAFSYSVSHDLRAPLRSIDGFSQALVEDYGDRLDDAGKDHLRRVCGAARRMGELIDDLLHLSRIGRTDLHLEPVDLSQLAREVADDLQVKDPARRAEWVIEEGLRVEGDARLLRVVLENLFGNAWKFTSKVPAARIELGAEAGASEAYFVRDNGDGFDMEHASKLFAPFQRMHSDAEFPGTGIGLATVQRVVDRHGGSVRATSAPSQGTTLYFTLPGKRRCEP